MGVSERYYSRCRLCRIVKVFALIGIRGINFGIEFVGTSINFHGTGDVSIGQMREAFANAGEPEAVVQTTNTDGQMA